jgi:NADPH-dependent ferric siderophore reductase
VFTERQVGTAWAYDVSLGDTLIVSSPAARSKKKEARSEVIFVFLTVQISNARVYNSAKY